MQRRAMIIGGTTLCLLSAVAHASEGTGSVKGAIHVSKGKGAKKKPARDVVVYIEGVPGAPRSKKGGVKEVKQINRKFKPKVMAVMVGTDVGFPNEDKIWHNVYSKSRLRVRRNGKDRRGFDLGRYRRGQSRTVTPQEPGVIEVECDVHHEMKAYVVVLDTPHFDVTGKDGEFELRGLPPGTYTLRVWTPQGAVKQRVTVKAGEETRVEETVPPPPKHDPARKHKDGSSRQITGS